MKNFIALSLTVFFSALFLNSAVPGADAKECYECVGTDCAELQVGAVNVITCNDQSLGCYTYEGGLVRTDYMRGCLPNDLSEFNTIHGNSIHCTGERCNSFAYNSDMLSNVRGNRGRPTSRPPWESDSDSDSSSESDSDSDSSSESDSSESDSN